MSLKSLLVEKIKSNRPKLSDKSIYSYVSTLANLPDKFGGSINETIGIKWYDDNAVKILEQLKDVTPNKRKSVLSALYVLTENKDIHSDMINDAKSVNEHYKLQRKSDKEKDNWIDWKDVLKIYDSYKYNANILFKKKILTQNEFFELNKFVLLSCFVLLPPRRVMDYALMKIKDFDIESDNYINKDKIVFNQYKTYKFYGRQTFEISKEFQNIIKKWSKVNETDFLIVSTHFKEMSPSQVTKLLNTIFGKNISADILRHSFLTDFFSGKMPTLIDMEQMSKAMAHSVQQQLLYVKQ